ncbi:zinc carboxypeptidase-like [Zerene cesonia]|uniref:zinc carboxypeptidase-like n=1 Tax=Zerene cesonia TaxID=33412 RepID=UPI0018E55AD9|nr:zinc carboxypeptidase-like [Zerene cesonia]
MKISYCLWIFLAVVRAKHESYSGWKSYYVTPSTNNQLETLGHLTNTLDLDFLIYATIDREGLVLVKPEYQMTFEGAVEAAGISFSVHADDVKRQLDKDDELFELRRNLNRNSSQAEMPYDDYQTLDVIYDYIDSIAEKYPNLVTLVTPAHSFEGRPIKYLKISSSYFQNETKSVVFLEATMHPREWLTPPVATYSIHRLVENLTDPELLDKFDWVILPVVNPDGYVYTFERERFWRKTRSTDQHPSSDVCPGVDINRNFDFVWNTVGVSTSPCGETYAGGRPASEAETRVIRDILHENLPRMVLYLSIHSYGSMILYSWGHDGSLSNYSLPLQTIGVFMAEKISERSLPDFPSYVVGNAKLVVGYEMSGSSHDYAHSIGVPLAYTWELPGLSRGLMGFHLDPRYIKHVVQETWDGIVVGAKTARIVFGK